MSKEFDEFMIKASYAEPNSFIFSLDNEPIIIIDEVGFKHKGRLIVDGGEVYKLFRQYLSISTSSQTEISDEEIEQEIHKRYMHPTQDYAFRDACKWYREQLKQRQ